MDISLIFVIVIMFYFCVIFPLQMRRYLHIRRQRLTRSGPQRPPTRNTPAYGRAVVYQNHNLPSTEQTNNNFVFEVANSSTGTESQSAEAIAATRHLEAEHRQQIIDIQREIEQQAVRRREERDPNAPHMPPKIINSSTVREPVVECSQNISQQIIDIQREIEQQAVRRREERREHDPYAPHMPPRIINSSTVRDPVVECSQHVIEMQREIERRAIRQPDERPSDSNYPHAPYRITHGTTPRRSCIYAITSFGDVGASNSSVNYPYAPPMPSDRTGHIHFPNISNSKDDELPSYEQAVTLDLTAQSAAVRRF